MTATTTSIGTTDVIELAFIPRNNSNNVSVADLENNPPPDVQEQPPAASTAAEEIQTPLTFLVAAKLTSACFAFFVAGTNDGSLGALIPYMIRGYRIGTGSVSILYACSFVGWVTAAMVGGYARAYFGSGGVLVLGAVMQLLAQALRIWVCLSVPASYKFGRRLYREAIILTVNNGCFRNHPSLFFW